MLFENSNLGGLITFIVIVAVAAVIGVVAFLIHRFLHPKLKSENEKPSDEQMMQEELDRVLEPIKDEKTAEEVNNYKDDENE